MNEDGGIPPTPPQPPEAPPAPPAAPPPGPPAGEPPSDGGRPGNSWERRDELGFGTGLVEGIKEFVTAPGDTFSKTLKSGDLASPILYAVIIATVMAVIGQIWSMIFGAGMMGFLPPEAKEAFGWMLASGGFGMVMAIFITPIFSVIGLFIWGGILHLCLLLVGGLEDSDAGFEGTVRSVAYSQTSYIAQLVPIIGGIVAFIWGLFLMVTGVTRIHGTSDGKAIAAILLPLVLCCLCVVAMFTFGVGAAFMGAANN